MRLEIERTLGIERASIDLEPGQIVEVVGPNASGKTSLAVCAQAVLARDANPLGLSAADAKRSYPHGGADDAQVSLTTELAAIVWQPARGTVISPIPFSESPYAHPEAVGLVDFTAKRGAKERAAIFQNALLPDPMTVLEAVRETLATYLPEADLVGVMEMLGERGWEPTASVYSDRGRQSKREWAKVTSTEYGRKKAADWRPDGWLADFDLMTVQEAEATVTDARDALTVLHRVSAVSETDAQRAKDATDALPGLQADMEQAKARHKAKVEERDALPIAAAAKELQRLQKLLDEAHQTLSARQVCPHCHEGVAVQGGKVVVASTPMVMASPTSSDMELPQHCRQSPSILTCRMRQGL